MKERSPKGSSQIVAELLPRLLWIVIASVLIFTFWDDLHALTRILLYRLKMGASFEVATLKIGATYISPSTPITPNFKGIQVNDDPAGERASQRDRYYKEQHRVMLVHRLIPSQQPEQLYDIEIFLLPHKEATLAGVKRVSYFFGPYWKNKVFVTENRSDAFAIAMSAYGPFLCTAWIEFSDGATAVAYRYIDFEMGSMGKLPQAEDKMPD